MAQLFSLGVCMIRAIFLVQLVTLTAIFAFGYWRKRRMGGYTYLDTCLVSVLLTLDLWVFAFYADSLAGGEAKQCRDYFPDGTYVLLSLLCGSLYAFVVGPIIALARWLARKDKKALEDDKADA